MKHVRAKVVASSNTIEDRSSRGVKRVKVLEAAAKALNQHGVSQTSLAAIAEGVGVSRAALYYYFYDQQDLVFQCYSQSCERMVESLDNAALGRDAPEKINRFVDFLLAGDAPECAALSEIAFLRAEQQDTILGLLESVRARLAGVLDEGARRGELRPCRSGVVAASIIGLISWLPTARRLPTSRELNQDDLLESVQSLLRIGIAADRRAPIAYQVLEFSSMSFPARQVFDAETMAAARREAVTAAASWLFNLKGVDATPLEEIALRLGVTKKVIYHNVGDKETLVAECYRRAFQFYEEIARSMEAYEGPGVDALCAGAHALAEASLREDITPLALVTGLEALPERAREEIQISSERLRQMYLRVYAAGQADGSIRKVNSQAMMNIIPGSFEWLPKWFEAFDAFDHAAAPREVAELLRLGLKPL
ncbi:MAG: TetR/AcrR family transcriptional regulator [Phenylobacterium sp.]|nr:MAG: TetR/AcrR family transcriptional regulator [Phenylobacterium sp.]